MPFLLFCLVEFRCTPKMRRAWAAADRCRRSHEQFPSVEGVSSCPVHEWQVVQAQLKPTIKNESQKHPPEVYQSPARRVFRPPRFVRAGLAVGYPARDSFSAGHTRMVECDPFSEQDPLPVYPRLREPRAHVERFEADVKPGSRAA
jgi:hypothetical protein